jgi:Holliday junction resolvase RusA-like endonuclease
MRVTITVPEIPPSVNHYKEPIIVRFRGKAHIGFKETQRAKNFKQLLAIMARGKSLDPITDKLRRRTKYRLRMIVFLGDGGRGDGDNFFKCVADGLVDAGVIHSDAAVLDWHAYVRRDVLNPRTVITIWDNTQGPQR